MKIRDIGYFAALGLTAAFCAACDTDPETPQAPPQVAATAVAQELDSVVCELAFECECTYGRAFESREECTAWADQEQAQVESLMAQFDLTWDPTCVGWYLRGYEQVECGSDAVFPRDLDGDGCNAQCLPLHGAKAVGTSCAELGDGFSDCGQGLRCDGGTCVEQCPGPVGLGESCRRAVCEEGTYCNFFDEFEPRCEAKAAEGDECGQVECNRELRCVIDDITDPASMSHCVPLAAPAESCMGHAECSTGYCPAGFCLNIPQEGDDCRGTGVCGSGLFCIDDVCAEAKERGQSCTTACGGGLDCLEGVCVGSRAAACYPESPVPGNG